MLDRWETTARRRKVAEELGAELEDPPAASVRHQVDPLAGLDLTVWVSRRWRGDIANRQPEEHDAIGWFGKDQFSGLSLADPVCLGLRRGLLSA